MIRVPLALDELESLNAYWRAANYLSVGQIYLLDNPLLNEPLQRAHIKPRLLGHWGTTPGLKMRFINVVALMTLQPQEEPPHGLSSQKFDSLFGTDQNALRTALDLAQQEQDQQDQQHQTETAGRTVAPAPAVWPSRESTNQHQDHNDQQDCS